MTTEELSKKLQNAKADESNWENSKSIAIDLLKEIDTSLHPSHEVIALRLDAVLFLCRCYLEQGSLAQALETATKAIEIIEKNPNKKFAAKYHFLHGRIHVAKHLYTEAFDQFSEALSIFEEIQSTSEIGNTYYNLGIVNEKLGKYNEALECYQKTLSIKEELQDKNGVADCLNSIGIVYEKLSEFEKSLDFYSQSLQIQEEVNNRYGIALTRYNIGMLYRNLGEYEKVLEFTSKALLVFEELGNKHGVAKCLNNIGIIYDNLQDRKKALEYYTKSLLINEETNNKTGIAIALDNMGTAVAVLGELEKSLEYHFKALNIYEETNDKLGMAFSLGNIGSSYADLGDNEKALEHHLRTQAIYEEINDIQGLGYTFLNIGAIFSKTDQSIYSAELAENNVLKSLDIFRQIGDKKGEHEAYNLLYSLYKDTGRLSEALEYLEQYVELEKILYSEQATNKARMLDHRRKIEESERDRQVKLARFQEKERLLHDILPSDIAERILQGETTIAEKNDNVSLFFSDIVGFTTISQAVEPEILVKELNTIFQEYDRIAKKYSVEKIKTIGDAYMAVSGLNPTIEHSHYNIAMFAMEVIKALQKLTLGRNHFQIRVGLHVGKVVSGVIGGYKFTFDIWGDTVNIASRMESHSEPGRIHVTEAFANKMKTYPDFTLIPRGEINIKGKGTMNTYWLEKG